MPFIFVHMALPDCNQAKLDLDAVRRHVGSLDERIITGPPGFGFD